MRLYIVIGPPGIGKTTVCTLVAERSNGAIKHLQFGDYIQRELGDLVGSREEMRRAASSLIGQDVIDAAIVAASSDIGRLEQSETAVLLETRDVAIRDYGFRGSPISAAICRRFGCAGIIVLYAQPSNVLIRAKGIESGRAATELLQIADHAALQRCYAVGTSILLDCPTHWIQADSDIEVVAQNLSMILGMVPRAGGRFPGS